MKLVKNISAIDEIAVLAERDSGEGFAFTLGLLYRGHRPLTFSPVGLLVNAHLSGRRSYRSCLLYILSLPLVENPGCCLLKSLL